jgi:hypothetical protein
MIAGELPGDVGYLHVDSNEGEASGYNLSSLNDFTPRPPHAFAVFSRAASHRCRRSPSMFDANRSGCVPRRLALLLSGCDLRRKRAGGPGRGRRCRADSQGSRCASVSAGNWDLSYDEYTPAASWGYGARSIPQPGRSATSSAEALLNKRFAR